MYLLSRRDWLRRFSLSTAGLWAGSTGLSKAQDMSVLGRVQDLSDARLRTFDEIVSAYVVRQQLKNEGMGLTMPLLADNGHLVPLSLKVDSPMTEESHVTHVYILSQLGTADCHVCAGTMEWQSGTQHARSSFRHANGGGAGAHVRRQLPLRDEPGVCH